MNKVLYSLLVVAGVAGACVKDNIISPAKQLKQDIQKIADFIAANNIVATKDSGGYWYYVDTLAVGLYPSLSDSAKLAFKAKLIPSLDVVDSTTITITLAKAISGIQMGLLKFTAGSYGRLYIPSGLAFGTNRNPNINQPAPIPANANLLYEMKIIKVYSAKLATDILSIDSYLQGISTIAVDDPTGIRYKINTAGAGPDQPLPNDDIIVTYTASVIGADTPFDSGASVQVALREQIPAWRIVLPQITEGSTVTLYVPSGYGYGSGADVVPAGSNLVYIITLESIIHH